MNRKWMSPAGPNLEIVIVTETLSHVKLEAE